MRYFSLKIILFFALIVIWFNDSHSNNQKKATATQLIHSSEKSIKTLIGKSEFENLKDLALEMENAALEINDISQCEGAGFGSNLSDFHLISSNGFSGGYKKTSFQMFCSAIAGSGSSMERDYASESRSFFEDLPNGHSVGQLAASRAAERLYPRKPPTGSYPVLFDERISNSFLARC